MASPQVAADEARPRAISLPWHGYAGLVTMIVSQVLMFAKVQPFYDWFTPIQWTSYILMLDALLVKLRGESFLFDHTREFLALALVSNVYWFMFEGYNLHLQNWKYINLPENLVVRMCGFIWAFATIYPGVLLTSEVLDELGFSKKRKTGAPARALKPVLKIQRWVHSALIIVGFLFCAVPLLVPAEIAKYLFVLVWIGFALWLDPINYRRQRPSLLRALEHGNVQKLLSLFAAGLICGLLWEFWNYWAGAKWIYTVPYFSEPKIFEMPLYGFLGFMAFAVECYVMWHFARSFLPETWRSRE